MDCRVNEVCEGLEVYLEDLPEWLGEDWVSLAQGNKVKTRSSELNLSLPNQTYSCHSNWNWSNKSCVFNKQLVLSLPSVSWVCFREVIAYRLIWLTSLLDYYCWLASYYLPSWSYYLAAISLRTLTLYHTWLWLACCSLSSAAYQLGHFYCLSSKLPCFEDFDKNCLFTPPSSR